MVGMRMLITMMMAMVMITMMMPTMMVMMMAMMRWMTGPRTFLAVTSRGETFCPGL